MRCGLFGKVSTSTSNRSFINRVILSCGQSSVLYYQLLFQTDPPRWLPGDRSAIPSLYVPSSLSVSRCQYSVALNSHRLVGTRFPTDNEISALRRPDCLRRMPILWDDSGRSFSCTSVQQSGCCRMTVRPFPVPVWSVRSTGNGQGSYRLLSGSRLQVVVEPKLDTYGTRCCPSHRMHIDINWLPPCRSWVS